MKRHLVMDLYHCNQTEEIGEWKPIEKGLPETKEKGIKVKVKLTNGMELFAYFYPDKCHWIATYGQEPCHFWSCITHEPMFDVMEWKSLKAPS